MEPIVESVEINEADLVRAARKNDLEAFNQLVMKYRNNVFDLAYRVLQSNDYAEDITQNVFILAFQKLYQFRGGSFRGWLLKIGTNLCYDELRNWKRVTLQSLEPLHEDNETYEFPDWLKDTSLLPEEAVESRELWASLEFALSKLPINYRTAVSLVDIQQLDYKKAAFAMGIPVGTLKSRLVRGRMQLRKNLANLDITCVPESYVFELTQ